MAEIADIMFTIDRTGADVSNANGLFDTINTRNYVRRGMRYAAEIYIVRRIPLHESPPTTQAVLHLDQQVSINRFFGQALARLVSYVHMVCANKLTRCPGSNIGIAVDFNVTFNVVFGGHIWGIAAEGTGPIASLVYTDEIDSEVVGEFHVSPVDHLEIVGLVVSISFHVQGISLQRGD
jgi:hypothetical protein